MSKALLHVAVGVIFNPDQKILIALRHPNAHQGGLWEFPGGKIEVGESVQQALRRELSEELGIDAVVGDAIVQVRHNYPDKSVLLDVWGVREFSGELIGKEGQPIRWVTITELPTYDFPEANQAIVQSLIDSLGGDVPGINV
jgi:8-oxo-dGTP diphosphatase